MELQELPRHRQTTKMGLLRLELGLMQCFVQQFEQAFLLPILPFAMG
jgi:hypothetical protein